MPMEMMSNLF